ncbi:lysozyme inhibitor LprI family protein, partial [Nitrospirillum amazonense]
MIRHRVLPTIATALLLASPALAAAPCATAGKRTERMICASPALRAEDAEIARLYKRALAKAGAHAAAVIAEQARWLATRDRLCGDLAPADDERARTCLARALPLRRAALAVRAAKPDQPFCDR